MSTTLSRDQLAHLAALARLKLNDDELAAFEHQFAEILAAFEGLQKADLAGVPELHQVTGLMNVTAADVPERRATREQMLASSRHPNANDQILVPSPHGTND